MWDQSEYHNTVHDFTGLLCLCFVDFQNVLQVKLQFSMVSGRVVIFYFLFRLFKIKIHIRMQNAAFEF